MQELRSGIILAVSPFLMYLYNTITYDGRLAQSPCTTALNISDDCISSTFVDDISSQPDESFYIRITSFYPHVLNTQNDTLPLVHTHGEHPLGGSLQQRIIRIEGVMIAKDPAGLEQAVRHLHHVWRTDSSPDFLHRGYFRLEWQTHSTNPNGDPFTLFCYARLHDAKPMFSIPKDFCGIVPWSVELHCADPHIYVQPDSNTPPISIPEGFIGGITVGDGSISTGQQQFSDVWDPVEIPPVTYYGNCQHDACSPMVLRITVNPAWQCPLELPPHAPGYTHGSTIGEHITFAHLESGLFVRLNHAMHITDEVIIDGLTGSAYLNGVLRMDIIDPISSGFPTLCGGSNTVVLSDDTHFRDHGKALIGELSYYPIW